MKFLLGIFFVLITYNFQLIQCSDFVSVLIPKTVKRSYSRSPLKMLVNEDLRTSNFAESKITIQIGRSNTTLDLIEDESKLIVFDKLRWTRNQNITMTLYGKKNINGEVVEQCSTQKRLLNLDESSFYIFIQTNKPFYRPGDNVSFQIIVVDKNLAPYRLNNIEVVITDPFNQTKQKNNDVDVQYYRFGLYEDAYNLNSSAPLGDWKINVVVDKRSHLKTSKVFHVKNFALPLFEVELETSSKYYFPYSKLRILFSAKYFHGDYVIGNAELIIQDTSNGRTYLSRIFNRTSGIERITINIIKDLKLSVTSQINLKATVIFTEPESDIKVTKSTFFSIQDSLNEEKNGTSSEDNIGYQEIAVPINIVDVNAECGKYKYVTTKYGKIGSDMKKIENPVNKLTLNYIIERNFETNMDTANIYVNSAFRMKNLLIAIVSKFEIHKAFSTLCNGQTVCNFSVEINDEMMPIFTVEVHHIKNMDDVEFGSVDIRTTNIGTNYLKMELSSSVANPKSNVRMTFDTKSDSKIFLLAFNKRLKLLNSKNDITEEDIIKKFSVEDRQTEVIFDDLTNWHECTVEEINRISTGRVHKITERSADFFDDEQIFEFDEVEEDDESHYRHEPKEEYLSRNNFPEIWLFENFEVDRSPITKKFRVPDSISSWYISAFSIHRETGLAVMEPQELIVKKDFFIQFELPSSIHYEEILRIDVHAFNNIQKDKSLEGKIIFQNLNSNIFEFVKYTNQGRTCRLTYNSNAYLAQNITVPGLEMKKVSFFIRSNARSADEFIKIKILAKAADKLGNVYYDIVEKKLKIRSNV